MRASGAKYSLLPYLASWHGSEPEKEKKEKGWDNRIRFLLRLQKKT